MSSISFGFPSLQPSHTEEEWFPRLETDELMVVNQLEDAVRQAEDNIRSYPFPAYVGKSAPEEEDDATADEDDDQEEKSRDAQDIVAPRAGEEAVAAAAAAAAAADQEEAEDSDLDMLQDSGNLAASDEEEASTGDEEMEDLNDGGTESDASLDL